MELTFQSVTVATILILATTALALWWRGIRDRALLVKHEENAWQEQREKQMVVEFLRNLTREIDTRKGRETLYPAIARAAVRGAGARAACVFELDSDGSLRPVASSGIFPPLKDIPPPLRTTETLRADLIGFALGIDRYGKGEAPILDEVARTGRSSFLADATNSPLINHIDDPTLHAHSLIVAPVAYGKKIFGVLAVANPEHGHTFDTGDFAYVKSLGDQGGVALHLHELFQLQAEKNRLDFDLSIASGVQKLLLPQTLPHHAGIDLNACYKPARQVGGDLYDIADLGDGRIAVLAADVSGKGVSASLVMTMAHTHLRHLMRTHTSPAELLRRLNAELLGDIRRGMFITLACAIVDTRAGALTLARAGHELPILLASPEGSVEPRLVDIATEGMALGMVPSEIFDEALTEITLPFRPGSTLVLFTDGLTEARNPEGVEYGTERLTQTLVRAHHAGAADINREILADLETFCAGIAPHDDLTLVTVKCLAKD